MGLFDITNNLSELDKKFWVDTEFTNNLIIANQGYADAGYSLRFMYPAKDDRDPLNLAYLAYKGADGTEQELGVLLLNTLQQKYGYSFKQKQSKWALLMHWFLEQTVCYMEAPAAKYKMKVVATRNLRIANNLSEHPISGFNYLNAVLTGNMSLFDDLASQHVEFKDLAGKLKFAAQELIDTEYTPRDSTLSWLAETFGTDKKKIKVFVQAQAMLNSGYTASEEGKCPYIKLKYNKGFYEMPTRITGTAYEVLVQTILVPLSFMRSQAEWVQRNLREGIVCVRFKKDNDVLRDMAVSANQAVLQTIFAGTSLDLSEVPCEFVEDRGYVRSIDLCSSALNGDVYRAVSLARVSGIAAITPDMNNLGAQLQPYGYHPSIANTDLYAVVPKFKEYVNKLGNNLAFLNMIYKGIGVGNNDLNSPGQAVAAITGYVDLQVSLTSSFVRKLHLYMLSNPLLFAGYTGKPQNLSNVSVSTSNSFSVLGLSK